ncbi:hypothetical protein [Salinisphaera orenii]|uniref:Uncharacterized protein n=1 Tax=Salinisphaera orenii YIM 95161 TaxID=1051139 RepID=A0A423PI00_9GAMM|nr:hypothetical protein [Salinisphaera halophila]ROO25184.1 hypothetical protein SAHL_14845 [Salinisphaera halophila YIM 95161]
MHRPGTTTRNGLIQALLCAATLSVFGTAMAHDHDEASQQPESKELSNEIETYNDNSGSLKEESAARSGMASEDTDTGNPSSSHGESATAEQLSEEVETYNENAGSLKEDSAARTGTLEKSPDPSPQGTSNTAQELSEEVDTYNENAGSLKQDSSADGDMMDEDE